MDDEECIVRQKEDVIEVEEKIDDRRWYYYRFTPNKLYILTDEQVEKI